jgi:hypothetical protein
LQRPTAEVSPPGEKIFVWRYVRGVCENAAPAGDEFGSHSGVRARRDPCAFTLQTFLKVRHLIEHEDR